MSNTRMGKKTQTPLNELRAHKGFTVAELAKKCDTLPSVVDKWLTGKCCPREKGLNKLAQALDVTPEWILETYSKKQTHKADNSYLHNARTIATDFWANVRKKQNVTHKMIAELLDEKKDSTTVAKYFTGDCMPSDKIIQNICDIFDVEFEKGKQEFQLLRENKRNKRKVAVAIVPTPEPTVNIPNDPFIAKATTLIPEGTPVKDAYRKFVDFKDDQIKSIGEMIYNKVTFDEFWAILSTMDGKTENENLPEMLYGKVDYNTFNKIQGMFDTL